MWQYRHVALVGLVCAVILFANLGGARLWDRDEPRNAGCALEMQRDGDYVVPRFDGELRTHKPVLLYWMIISAYEMFGVNEFAARFWCAVCGVGTVLATYVIGRRLFHPQVGLWAAIILGTTFMFDVASRAATPDSPLILFATLGIMVFVLATFPAYQPHEPAVQRRPQRNYPSWAAVIAMNLFLGIAILAKGPVGLVLPTAVIGMYLLIQRLGPTGDSGSESRWWSLAKGVLRPFAPVHFLKTCWSMRPLTALAVALAVALPWYIWVGIRTDGAWIEGFLLEHNLGRAVTPMEGHRGWIIYYPVALMIGFFPWSLFILPSVISTIRRLRSRDPWMAGYTLAACWVGVYLCLFTVAQTKLPSYITPCYPGMALLVGCFIHHWRQGAKDVSVAWMYTAYGVLAAVGVAIAVGIPLAAKQILPGEESLGLLGVIPLVGAVAAIQYTRRQRLKPASFAMATTAVLLALGIFGWATARVSRHNTMHEVFAGLQDRDDIVIGGLGSLQPSWVFYSGHTFQTLHAPGPKSVEEVGQRPSWQPPPPIDAETFLRENPDHFLLTTDRDLHRLGSRLPDNMTIVAEAPCFLKDYRVLLIGWSEQARQIARRKAQDRVHR